MRALELKGSGRRSSTQASSTAAGVADPALPAGAGGVGSAGRQFRAEGGACEGGRVYAAGGCNGCACGHAIGVAVSAEGVTAIGGVGSMAAHEPELHHAQCGVCSLLGAPRSLSAPSHCTPLDVQTGIEPSPTIDALATDISSPCISSAAIASAWMNVLRRRLNFTATDY
jgi:hypothetical protein